MGKASQTGGVKPMSIAGRYVRERERCLGMTDAERTFRAQWLKDQELGHSEPRYVKGLYEEQFNPIRRLYKAPLNAVQKAIEPVVGAERALKFRWLSGKGLILLSLAYVGTYYWKYNSNDWTRHGGMRAVQSRIAVVEGDPEYPKVSDRSKGEDYASRGFKDVKLNL